MNGNVQQVFRRYDSVVGIHRKLHYYIQDVGDWKLRYFIAHLSHEVYKSRGVRGHVGRQRVRASLLRLASKISMQVESRRQL